MVRPRLIDEFPDLAREIRDGFLEDGYSRLAEAVDTLEIFGPCGCGEDFCASIRTSDHPKGIP